MAVPLGLSPAGGAGGARGRLPTQPTQPDKEGGCQGRQKQGWNRERDGRWKRRWGRCPFRLRVKEGACASRGSPALGRLRWEEPRVPAGLRACGHGAPLPGSPGLCRAEALRAEALRSLCAGWPPVLTDSGAAEEGRPPQVSVSMFPSTTTAVDSPEHPEDSTEGPPTPTLPGFRCLAVTVACGVASTAT